MNPVNNVAPGSIMRSRLLEKLLAGQGRLNNGTVTGGIAHALQQGLSGYQAGQAMQAEKAQQQQGVDAQNAMVRGMSAQQWTPPDEQIAMGPSGTAKGDVMIPREAAMQNAAPAGGYDGAIYALQGLGPDNAPAGRLATQLLMGKMDRDQTMADRLDERTYQAGVRDENRGWQKEMFDLEQRAAMGRLSAQEESQLRLLKVKKSMEASKPVGAPYEAVDANGQPVFVQRYGDGSVQPVNGYSPAPPKPVPGRDVPLPEDVYQQQIEKARVQGEATASNRPFTEGETKAGGFAVRMVGANERIGQIVNGPDGKPGTADDYDPTQYSDATLRGVPFVGNSLQSDQGRQYYQAMSDWVTANLRKESGAVIGVDEMENEFKKYFPQPGDDMQTIQQKGESRRLAEAGMRTAAGRSYDEIRKDLGDPTKNSGWSIKKVQ